MGTKNLVRGIRCDLTISNDLTIAFGQSFVPASVTNIESQAVYNELVKKFPHRVASSPSRVGYAESDLIVLNGDKEVRVVRHDGSNLKCNFFCTGVTRQRQLVALNQHFNDRLPTGLGAPKGMKLGGTPIIGESEVAVMRARSLTHNLRLAMFTDDLVSVSLCTGCRMIKNLFCTCENSPGTTTLNVRYAMIRVMVFLTCWQLTKHRHK